MSHHRKLKENKMDIKINNSYLTKKIIKNKEIKDI
jgi:hypothetical protein